MSMGFDVPVDKIISECDSETFKYVHTVCRALLETYDKVTIFCKYDYWLTSGTYPISSYVFQGQSDSDGVVAVALKAQKVDMVKYLLDQGFKSPPQDVSRTYFRFSLYVYYFYVYNLARLS